MTECQDNCSACGISFVAHPDQPIRADFFSQDGVQVVQMHIPKAETYVPTHAHKYDHLSMLASGSVRFWQDGKLLGDFKAPHGFNIPKAVKHMFMSLEDNTVMYCCHNAMRRGEIEVLSEHHLVDAGGV